MIRSLRLPVAALIATLLTAAAQAQSTSSMGGGRGGHRQKTEEKSTEQKPKVDEKAYNAALRTLPDKKYDPWHNAR